MNLKLNTFSVPNTYPLKTGQGHSVDVLGQHNVEPYSHARPRTTQAGPCQTASWQPAEKIGNILKSLALVCVNEHDTTVLLLLSVWIFMVNKYLWKMDPIKHYLCRCGKTERSLTTLECGIRYSVLINRLVNTFSDFIG